jgi:pyruvate dehydrogenase kinase 2/3/4
MVQFGARPSTGTLFRASQFLSEELPIRLAHRVQELGDLPDGLNEMPSIERVQNWYAQSFEVWGDHSRSREWAILTVLNQELTTLPRPQLSKEVRDRLLRPPKRTGRDAKVLSQNTQNPSVEKGQYRSAPDRNGNVENGGSSSGGRRYFVAAEDGEDWPPELQDYNKRFAATLDKIKRRHDSVVTTVGSDSPTP